MKLSRSFRFFLMTTVRSEQPFWVAFTRYGTTCWTYIINYMSRCASHQMHYAGTTPLLLWICVNSKSHVKVLYSCLYIVEGKNQGAVTGGSIAAAMFVVLVICIIFAFLFCYVRRAKMKIKQLKGTMNIQWVQSTHLSGLILHVDLCLAELL